MTAPTLPKIPVVVISANEAAKLRESIDWFRPARVTVAVEMDQGLRPIYNVVASLAGRDQPDRRIMLGTHHDAWTFGGVDPGTGMAALLEVAKGIGALAKDGWRPSRTIEFAFWDAEEFGLIGSTEYAEEFRSLLQEQLIVYINTDMYMDGRFDPGGAPALRDFVSEAVRDVQGTTAPSSRPGIRNGRRSAAAPTSCRFRITLASRRCRSSSSVQTATGSAPIIRTSIRARMWRRLPILVLRKAS